MQIKITDITTPHNVYFKCQNLFYIIFFKQMDQTKQNKAVELRCLSYKYLLFLFVSLTASP